MIDSRNLFAGSTVYAAGVISMGLGAGLIGFAILPRAKGGENHAR